MVEQVNLIEDEDEPVLEEGIKQPDEEVEVIEPLIEEEPLVVGEGIEVQQAPEPTRRSTRTTACQTSNYESYSMLTQG